MSHDLVEAYLRTVVELRWDPATHILLEPAPTGTTIGDFPARRSLHVITAHNPRSERLDDATNEARDVRLAAELDRRGLVTVRATGRSPDGSWVEPGWGLVDASRDVALALAASYDQNAVFEWTPQHLAVVWLDGRLDLRGWRATVLP